MSRCVLLLLFFAAVLLAVMVAQSEAKMMGRGGGRKPLKPTRKPWDTNSRYNKPLYMSRYEDFNYGQPTPTRSGPPPCVGLCYYMKVMALKNPKPKTKTPKVIVTLAPGQTSTAPPSTTRRPVCVGLCYYYKSRGLKNPYENMRRK